MGRTLGLKGIGPQRRCRRITARGRRTSAQAQPSARPCRTCRSSWGLPGLRRKQPMGASGCNAQACWEKNGEEKSGRGVAEAWQGAHCFCMYAADAPRHSPVAFHETHCAQHAHTYAPKRVTRARAHAHVCSRHPGYASGRSPECARPTRWDDECVAALPASSDRRMR